MVAEIGKFKINKKDKMQIKRRAREAKLEKKREKENASFSLKMEEEMNKEPALENSKDMKTKNDDEGLRRSKRNKKGEKAEEMEEEKKVETMAEPMDE